MAHCKTCEEPIFWAKQELRDETIRWRPCELESVRDEDVLHEGERGPYIVYRAYHVVHRCGLKSKRESSAAPSGPHAALHLLPTAPKEVARAAYRALASLHHPDVGGNSQRMAEINEAYEQICGKR